eukprot:m.78302 g.78302  ORF g.78302 m.78302 type:complete len:174 (-) comp25103_c0_seq1:169-690(-)
MGLCLGKDAAPTGKRVKRAVSERPLPPIPPDHSHSVYRSLSKRFKRKEKVTPTPNVNNVTFNEVLDVSNVEHSECESASPTLYILETETQDTGAATDVGHIYEYDEGTEDQHIYEYDNPSSLNGKTIANSDTGLIRGESETPSNIATRPKRANENPRRPSSILFASFDDDVEC